VISAVIFIESLQRQKALYISKLAGDKIRIRKKGGANKKKGGATKNRISQNAERIKSG
jgi:hypothetical protein